jgi:hypothetical protein
MANDSQHEHSAQADGLSCNSPASQRFLPDADPPLGAHLVTPRRGYTHHGIYVGDGDVVHYAGLSRSLHRGPVRKVPLQQFAAGHPVWIKRATCPKYSGQQAVQRACSRLGEDSYRLTTNNCEHFCEWCVCGESCSEQIDKLLAWPHTVIRAAIRRLGQILGVGLNTAHRVTVAA